MSYRLLGQSQCVTVFFFTTVSRAFDAEGPNLILKSRSRAPSNG
jgi:hypothetical protein